MRSISTFLLVALLGQPAMAHSEADEFRTVAFICSSSSSGAATKIVENILGQRRSFKVKYMDDQATLFVVSRARHGNNFRTVKMIDLRSETHSSNLRAADAIARDMALDADRYCKGKPREKLAARDELLASHQFNRAHPRYRGR